MAKTRYDFGGTVEQTTIGAGLWTRREFEHRADDVPIVLTEHTRTHMNIITYKLYGDDSLGWLVMQYNNIIDPVEELVPGRTIVMPHPSRIV